MSVRVIQGDCRDVLRALPERSVQTVVTSPPYHRLRDYGHPDQIGQEDTLDAYVTELVAVFREVRRVLAADGTVWINLGDGYGAGKQLLGVPWRVAFALQADGWVLRSSIVWHKPCAMPDAATDRPTNAHEMVFFFAKEIKYFFDANAIAEDATSFGRKHTSKIQSPKTRALQGSGHHGKGGNLGINYERTRRNCRNVWSLAHTERFGGLHFATMPPALAERCILAGSRRGDTVLDPFAGAGTTLLAADRLGRDAVGAELNPDYVRLIRERIAADAGLFAEVAS